MKSGKQEPSDLTLPNSTTPKFHLTLALLENSSSNNNLKSSKSTDWFHYLIEKWSPFMTSFKFSPEFFSRMATIKLRQNTLHKTSLDITSWAWTLIRESMSTIMRLMKIRRKIINMNGSEEYWLSDKKNWELSESNWLIKSMKEGLR